MKMYLAAGILLLAVVDPTAAGIVVYQEGAKKIEVGGRLQLQYHTENPDEGSGEDDLFFRRLRPYILGSVTEDWDAKIQFDLGKASSGNEVAVKDAWMRYQADKMTVKIGNMKPYFSREFLTSSKRQQLVERTFSGDHNYGSPDRALGLGLEGKSNSKKMTWGAFVGQASIDPDAKKLDFDSPVNRDTDFNQGWLTSGRLDFHPAGELKKDQGDFGGESKFTFGVAAFSWSNDGDNNSRTAAGVSTDAKKADIDSVTGFELSAGFRGNGFSGDLELQSQTADTVDAAFSGGLYRNGTADLSKLSLEGGYMIRPERVEVAAGYESLDADTYQDKWNRTSVGVNCFWNKHKVKVQATYRIGENLDGVSGFDADEAFVQFQFVF